MTEPNPAKRPVGHPPIYSNPEDLSNKIEEYFISGVAKKKIFIGSGDKKVCIEVPIPTISGLVLYCGYCSRQSFYDLESDPKFSYTIKRARLRIEQDYEQDLKSGLGAGAIFALKNFGWKDVTEHTGEVTLQLSESLSGARSRLNNYAEIPNPNRN